MACYFLSKIHQAVTRQVRSGKAKVQQRPAAADQIDRQESIAGVVYRRLAQKEHSATPLHTPVIDEAAEAASSAAGEASPAGAEAGALADGSSVALKLIFFERLFLAFSGDGKEGVLVEDASRLLSFALLHVDATERAALLQQAPMADAGGGTFSRV